MTHPFHPWTGREFELIDLRQTWGEDRVYIYDDEGELARLPAGWTDIVGTDLFVSIGDQRARFRMDDLLRLVELVGDCSEDDRGRSKDGV